MKISIDQIPAYGNYYDKGETIKLRAGYTALVRYDYDQDYGAPWENCDGHGPVSEWTSRDKAPGERILSEDRGSRRYYDYAEAMRIAKREGWDAEPYRTGTKGERARRAVDRDFEFLRAWCNDEWHYIGVMVTVFHNGIEIAEDSLWGIEDCGDYWREIAADMIETAIQQHKEETRERNYWACRDVVTV